MQAEQQTTPFKPINLDLIEGYRLFFGLLGMTLYAHPSYELFNSLYRTHAFAELPLIISDENFLEGTELLSTWGPLSNHSLSQEEFHTLLAESTRLFAGTQSMEAIPWESAYFNKERMVFQRETLDVRTWYRTYDLQLVRYNHEPEDHIGLEMDFISRLLAQTKIAAEEGRMTDAQKTLADAQLFAAQHPLRWADRWSQGVSAIAQTPLYQGIAKLIPPALDAFATTA